MHATRQGIDYFLGTYIYRSQSCLSCSLYFSSYVDFSDHELSLMLRISVFSFSISTATKIYAPVTHNEPDLGVFLPYLILQVIPPLLNFPKTICLVI
jgi:ABC-type transport system involved in cytochrome c biogenesis permease component